MVLKAHLGPVQQGDDQRQQSRRELFLETSGSMPGGFDANVTVHNISATGMLIETEVPLSQGERLAIELPQVGQVEAQVVWESAELFGCEFDEDLGPSALAAVELRSEAAFAEPTVRPGPAMRSAGELLGPKLNRLRKERGLTLAQVADELGVSKPTVWAWEKGKARPVPDRYEAIARALGVSVDELTEIAAPGESDALLQETRIRIATAYGTSPDKVRIMIEL